MQSQTELKVIVPKQSVLAQIMGWLPVVVITSTLIIVVNLIQSTMSTSAIKPAAKVATAEVIEISYWPLWILALAVIIVSAVILKYKDTLKEKSWWKNKEDDSKKLFWYIVVIFIAYFASGIAPEGAAVAFKGIAALAGVHFIWSTYPGKPAMLTWIIVGGMITYFVLAWLIPPVVDIRNAGVDVLQLKAEKGAQYMKKYAENLKACNGGKPECTKGDIETPSAQSTHASQSSLMTTSQVLHLVPGGGFQKVMIPVGAKVIENSHSDCFQGCIVQLEHDSDRICTAGGGIERDQDGRNWYAGTYQGTTCLMTVVSEDRGVPRYREKFLVFPGKDPQLPPGLLHVIITYGTDENLGPVDVNITTVTSG